MNFHLIDPKAGINSANSAQNHFNTSTTAWVYFRVKLSILCSTCMYHYLRILDNPNVLVRLTPGARNLYFKQNAK